MGSVQRVSAGVHNLMEKGPKKNENENGNREGLTITGGTSRGAIFLAYQTDSEEIAVVCTFVGTRNSLKRALPIK